MGRVIYVLANGERERDGGNRVLARGLAVRRTRGGRLVLFFLADTERLARQASPVGKL